MSSLENEILESFIKWKSGLGRRLASSRGKGARDFRALVSGILEEVPEDLEEAASQAERLGKVAASCRHYKGATKIRSRTASWVSCLRFFAEEQGLSPEQAVDSLVEGSLSFSEALRSVEKWRLKSVQTG